MSEKKLQTIFDMSYMNMSINKLKGILKLNEVEDFLPKDIIISWYDARGYSSEGVTILLNKDSTRAPIANEKIDINLSGRTYYDLLHILSSIFDNVTSAYLHNKSLSEKWREGISKCVFIAIEGCEGSGKSTIYKSDEMIKEFILENEYIKEICRLNKTQLFSKAKFPRVENSLYGELFYHAIKAIQPNPGDDINISTRNAALRVISMFAAALDRIEYIVNQIDKHKIISGKKVYVFDRFYLSNLQCNIYSNEYLPFGEDIGIDNNVSSLAKRIFYREEQLFGSQTIFLYRNIFFDIMSREYIDRSLDTVLDIVSKRLKDTRDTNNALTEYDKNVHSIEKAMMGWVVAQNTLEFNVKSDPFIAIKGYNCVLFDKTSETLDNL